MNAPLSATPCTSIVEARDEGALKLAGIPSACRCWSTRRSWRRIRPHGWRSHSRRAVPRASTHSLRPSRCVTASTLSCVRYPLRHVTTDSNVVPPDEWMLCGGVAGDGSEPPAASRAGVILARLLEYRSTLLLHRHLSRSAATNAHAPLWRASTSADCMHNSRRSAFLRQSPPLYKAHCTTHLLLSARGELVVYATPRCTFSVLLCSCLWNSLRRPAPLPADLPPGGVRHLRRGAWPSARRARRLSGGVSGGM